MIAVELQEMFEDTRRVIRNTTQLINNTATRTTQFGDNSKLTIPINDCKLLTEFVYKSSI
jgi:hypothetical protein